MIHDARSALSDISWTAVVLIAGVTFLVEVVFFRVVFGPPSLFGWLSFLVPLAVAFGLAAWFIDKKKLLHGFLSWAIYFFIYGLLRSVVY